MKNKLKSICVIGQGYIGLPTTLLLKKKFNKWNITGFDKDKTKISNLSKGNTFINETDIKILLKKLYKKIFFSSKIKVSDCYIICVPTPVKRDKSADLSFVYSAVDEISKVLKKGDSIILESTVPVGTTEKIINYLAKKNKNIKFKLNESDINVIFSPERVLPGNIFYELLNNKRIIGVRDYRSKLIAKEIFGKLVNSKISFTNLNMAEMIKLSENTYRDINIAYANLLSLICDKFKLDHKKLIFFANEHPRVNILQPGIGVGGHCIPIDPYFLAQSYKKNHLIMNARNINDFKTKDIIKKINILITKYKKKPRLIFCGITYKKNSDDVRESPAIKIINYFVNKNFKFAVFEPNLRELPKKLKDKRVLLIKKNQIKSDDILIILIDHDKFKNIKKSFPKNRIVNFT